LSENGEGNICIAPILLIPDDENQEIQCEWFTLWFLNDI